MREAQKGMAGYMAKEIARVSSRADKSDLAPSEMLSKWKTEMDGMGWTTKSIIDKLDFEQNRLGYSTRTDEELMRGFVRKHQRQNIAEHGPVEYGQPDQETKDRDNALVRGFLRKHKELHFTEDQFKAHMVKQLINDMDKNQAKREAARIFEEHCVHMVKNRY